jgi:hypothetical protein
VAAIDSGHMRARVGAVGDQEVKFEENSVHRNPYSISYGVWATELLFGDSKVSDTHRTTRQQLY